MDIYYYRSLAFCCSLWPLKPSLSAVIILATRCYPLLPPCRGYHRSSQSSLCSVPFMMFKSTLTKPQSAQSVKFNCATGAVLEGDSGEAWTNAGLRPKLRNLIFVSAYYWSSSSHVQCYNAESGWTKSSYYLILNLKTDKLHSTQSIYSSQYTIIFCNLAEIHNNEIYLLPLLFKATDVIRGIIIWLRHKSWNCQLPLRDCYYGKICCITVYIALGICWANRETYNQFYAQRNHTSLVVNGIVDKDLIVYIMNR